jgi:hypothetical protein
VKKTDKKDRFLFEGQHPPGIGSNLNIPSDSKLLLIDVKLLDRRHGAALILNPKNNSNGNNSNSRL